MLNGAQALSDPPVSAWLVSTMSSLAELARLREDWDSYGSKPIQAPAVETAIRLLLQIAREEPAKPHISPVPGGGVQIEWHTPERALEIEVLPDGGVEYLAVEGEKLTEGSIPAHQLSEACAWIRWLKSN
jgi:hypothetical protein